MARSGVGPIKVIDIVRQRTQKSPDLICIVAFLWPEMRILMKGILKRQIGIPLRAEAYGMSDWIGVTATKDLICLYDSREFR